MRIEFNLNSDRKALDVDPNVLLLTLVRRERCYSVKHGCETGDCGACAVLVDGRPIVSCLMLAVQVDGREVTTLESLGAPDDLHPLQRAFVDGGAIQCGYCTPAMILVASSLLHRSPGAGEAEIRDALAGVLCRCTGYVKPIEAILTVAKANDPR